MNRYISRGGYSTRKSIFWHENSFTENKQTFTGGALSVLILACWTFNESFPAVIVSTAFETFLANGDPRVVNSLINSSRLCTRSGSQSVAASSSHWQMKFTTLTINPISEMLIEWMIGSWNFKHSATPIIQLDVFLSDTTRVGDMARVDSLTYFVQVV